MRVSAHLTAGSLSLTSLSNKRSLLPEMLQSSLQHLHRRKLKLSRFKIVGYTVSQNGYIEKYQSLRMLRFIQ